MNSLIELVKAMTTCGTRACGLLCAVLGVALAALLLTIGFWRTLFVVALGAAGMFAGESSGSYRSIRFRSAGGSARRRAYGPE